MMIRYCLYSLTVVCFAATLQAGSIASSRSRLSVTIRLVPHASVVGTTQRVSFGLPLPPGILDDPGQVRVGTDDVRAMVKSLGNWRTVPSVDLLCGGLPPPTFPGIRAVLVQFDQRFETAEPVSIQIQIGVGRARSLAEAQAPTASWRAVDDGTYGAAAQAPFGTSYAVREPTVLAILPPWLMTCAGLSTMTPPAGTKRTLRAFDAAQIKFFDTVINQFNPRPLRSALADFYTDDEPWLYDRAQAFYNTYIRTGDAKHLREAHRASEQYLALLFRAGDCPKDIPEVWCRGFFRLKSPPDRYYKDSKYSYSESLATRYWLTADDSVLSRISDVTSATRTEVSPHQLQNPSTFTERHTANALLAAVVEYEIAGNDQQLAYITSILDTLGTMQANPMQQQPPNGCFNHHPEGMQSIGFSPWMSSLLAHALLRAYFIVGDRRIPGMLVGLARCQVQRAVYDTTELDGSTRKLARYLAGSYGNPRELDSSDGSADPWRDMEHAIDVAYVTALGAYFASSTAERSAFADVTRALVTTHTYVLEYWTRPDNWPGNGLPLYRVSPPRKYAWWTKNAAAIGWALDGRAAFPPGAVLPGDSDSVR